jgi:hypothetical protein
VRFSFAATKSGPVAPKLFSSFTNFTFVCGVLLLLDCTVNCSYCTRNDVTSLARVFRIQKCSRITASEYPLEAAGHSYGAFPENGFCFIWRSRTSHITGLLRPALWVELKGLPWHRNTDGNKYILPFSNIRTTFYKASLRSRHESIRPITRHRN